MVAMDGARRTILLETMGARPADDIWPRRHFKKRSYQPPDGLESPKEATVSHLATLIFDQRLVVGCRLGLDVESLGIGVSTVLAIDIASDPVVQAFFQYVLKQGGIPKDAEGFFCTNMICPFHSMKCGSFTGNKSNLRYMQMDERDVGREA